MKKLFPAIHCQNWEQTKRNLELVSRCGVDGVFLVNHRIPHPFLTVIAQRAVEEYPSIKIGVNYLDLEPIMALSLMPEECFALWTDQPNLVEDPMVSQPEAQMFLDYRAAKQSSVKYYGSVAFKYQPPVRDIELMSRIAAQYVDVVTTSGKATGEPAPLNKIKKMKKVLEDKPFALASGVTAENISEYLPYVDEFIVATGISVDFNTLDEKKTKELATIIHAA